MLIKATARWFFIFHKYEYSSVMNIKKRLSLAQIKRQALLHAGIRPSGYGKKKSTTVMANKKKKLNTRKEKYPSISLD
mgnify:CR=1 FL=1